MATPFSLRSRSDDDNVLRLLYNDPEVSNVFWPDHWLLNREAGRSPYNSSRIASLDSSGKFTSTDNFSFIAADYGESLQRRLSLDYDGNLRLYSRKNRGESWVISWEASSRTCKIHGACGPNSVCRYIPSFGRNCSCLPGFKIRNHTDLCRGCEPELKVSCEKSDDEVTFLHLPHVEMYGYEFGFLENYTLEMCKQVCLERCDCKGFVFKYVFERFTYAELKKATKNFREEMGRRASGIVYKGILQDNRVAAIKRLNNELGKEGNSEFLAEVSIIGRLNHMNLLEMWGYSAEGKHMLLVYEYMLQDKLPMFIAMGSLCWRC